MRHFLLGLCLFAAACAAPTAPTAGAVAGLQVVFLGDSITAGAGLPDPATQSAAAACAAALRELRPGTPVTFANQGHSGHTTLDFLPGGSDCDGALAAARALHRQPGALVFSVMLGTNDSANHGTHGAPVDAATYRRNLQALLATLLAQFPDAQVVLHQPIWYSPNTHNASDYEGAPAAERLRSYFPVLAGLAADDPRVHVGDTRAYDWFAAHHATAMAHEAGRNGVFFLHPDAGGAAALGRFWAEAMVAAVPPR